MQNPQNRHAFLTLGMALLLFAAAHRILTFAETEMHIDEIWSVWQTLGTPLDIINWTPFDWTPLGYLAIGGWRGLVGMHPVVLRALPLFFFLISAALLYRVGRRITHDDHAALLITLVYAAFGYSIRASTEVRGYMLAILLLIALWWLIIRYLERPRPGGRFTGGLVSLCIAVSFYTYMPSVIGWLAIGIYGLAVYRLRALRIWLPALVGIALVVPGVLWRLGAISERTSLTWHYTGGFFDMLWENFRTFAVYRYEGYPLGFWVGAFVVATLALAGWVLRNRAAHGRNRLWGLAAWVFVLPCILYIFHGRTDFFRLHYAMMWMIGLVVWIGWGFGRLRVIHRAFVPLSAAAVVIIMLLPTQLTYYAGYWRPFMSSFSWLRERLRAEDIVVIDPNCCLGHRYEWDYFIPLYFPNGLNVQAVPGDARRVWYVSYRSQEDAALEDDIEKGRISREFVGPPEFLIRLYEAPPDREGIAFDDNLRFHGVDIMRGLTGESVDNPRTLVRREGEALRLRLWWSADAPSPLDYSVGVYLLGADGRLIAQSDGAPALVTLEYPPDPAPRETSRWLPGRYYVEERILTLPTQLKFETLTGLLSVYDWGTGERLAAPGMREDLLLELFTMRVESWTGGLP